MEIKTMVSKFDIKDMDGNVLYSYECENNSFKKTFKYIAKDHVLNNPDLRGVDLSDLVMDKFAGIVGGNLNGADFTNFQANDFSLKDVNAYFVDFNGAVLVDAKFIGCKMNVCDFTDAELDEIFIDRCQMVDAKFGNASLTYSKITNTDLTGADLKNADFENSDLSFSTLIKTKLDGINLKNCKLNETVFKYNLNESMKNIFELEKRHTLAERKKSKLNEGEDYGWIVDTSEAQTAYDFFVDQLGDESKANEEIVRAIGYEKLADILAYLFRMYDLQEWKKIHNAN